MQKKHVFITGLLLGVLAARGEIITDDFNRADTDYGTPDGSIGGAWINGSSSDRWSITNGVVNMDVTGGSATLINNALETISGDGDRFTLRADIAQTAGGTSSGLVFNFQDADNYYVLRFNPTRYQVFAVYNGTIESVLSVTQGSYPLGAFHTVTITSSNAYHYTFTITEQGSSTVINTTTTWTDPNDRFTGGTAGFYGMGNTGVLPEGSFDNFSLETISGYEAWALQWGGTNVIGSGSADYDGDGLPNIYEYGLGGNPTDDLDSGARPEYYILNEDGTNVFTCIYPQRSGSDGELVYALALATNLVEGNWITNTGYAVTGTNVTGEALNFVTNTVSMEADRRFIRLLVAKTGTLKVTYPVAAAGLPDHADSGVEGTIAHYLAKAAPGDTVLLNADGDFTVDATLVVPEGVTLMCSSACSNARLVASAGLDGKEMIALNNNSTLSGIRADANREAHSCVDATGKTNVLIDGCVLYDTKNDYPADPADTSDSFGIIQAPDSGYVTIKNCYLANSGYPKAAGYNWDAYRCGVNARKSDYCMITNCVIEHTLSAAIDLMSTVHATVLDNTVSHTGLNETDYGLGSMQDAITGYHGSIGHLYRMATDMIIQGNSIYERANHAIHVSGERIYILDNQIYRATHDQAVYVGDWRTPGEDSADVYVRGNVIWDSTTTPGSREIRFDRITLSEGHDFDFGVGDANPNIIMVGNTVPVVANLIQHGIISQDPERTTDYGLFEEFNGTLGPWQTANVSSVVINPDTVEGTAVSDNPQVYVANLPGIMIDDLIPCSNYTYVAVNMMLEDDASITGSVNLYFTTTLHESYTGCYQNVIPDGGYHTYTFGVAGKASWEGTLTGLRIDPYNDDSGIGKRFSINWVRFL